MDTLNLMHNLLQKQKVVDTSAFRGWQFTCYFGPSILKEDALEHSAYAVTRDLGNATKPVLRGNNCMQIIFDDKQSVVCWSAANKSVLTRKIKEAYPGFTWRKTDDSE